MEIKNHKCKIGVFLINLLVLVLAVCGIKEKEKENFTIKTESDESISPVNQDILNLQNLIATERGNKLRDLNTSAKEIEQQNTTTTKTTVTPETVKTPDKKTKTS